jgi:hypothetical protein
MFVLFNFIAVIAVMIADNVFGLTMKGIPYGALSCMYMVAAWPPVLALAVRRLHDTGKSGWWILINLIPLAGPVWFLVLTLTDGQPGANPYGASPKEHDGFGAKRKTRSAAVALIFAAGLLFIGFLNSAISFWLEGTHVNMYFWTSILHDIIPVAALLVAGIALLRRKDRAAVAAIALLIASGLRLLLSVYSICDVIYHAEMLQEQGRYMTVMLFRLAWIIYPVTLGIAGLALLLPRVKLKIPLLIASCLFVLMCAVSRISIARIMHGAGLDLDNLLYEFAKFFINHLAILTPVAMLTLAYMLPGRKGAEEADETQAEDHHSDAFTPGLPDGADYALLHLYRPSKIVGGMISYNVKLDDTVVYRASFGSRASIKITQGNHILSAKTESRTTLPLTVIPGKEYYVQCSLGVGFFVGHPKMKLVETDAQSAPVDFPVNEA